MAASRRLRQPCKLSPGIAPPSSWGFSRAVRRVVLGTTAPAEGWVVLLLAHDAVGAPLGHSERGEGWWGCSGALLHLPPFAVGGKVPAPSFLLAGFFRSALWFEITNSIRAGEESVIDRASSNLEPSLKML